MKSKKRQKLKKSAIQTSSALLEIVAQLMPLLQASAKKAETIAEEISKNKLPLNMPKAIKQDVYLQRASPVILESRSSTSRKRKLIV